MTEHTDSNKVKDESASDNNLCRSNNLHLNLLELSLSSRTEIHDQSNNNAVIAARTTDFGLHWPRTRTDFFVQQKDGTLKNYEENPTPFSSLFPSKAEKTGPLFEYDPKTDSKGKALDSASNEQIEAHNALYALRAKFTPKVIAELPACPKD